MFNKLLNHLANQKAENRRADLHRKLLRQEAKIGGQIFGPVKPGARREFFCMDEHTWVWHEEWVGGEGQKQYMTTRYDIRPNGIVKSQNGHYRSVDAKEAQTLLRAAKLYQQRVSSELYPFVA